MWTVREMNIAFRRNGIHNIKILSKKVKSPFANLENGFGLYRINGNKKELLLDHFNMSTLLHDAVRQNILSKQIVENIIKTYRSILSIKLPSGRTSDDWVCYMVSPAQLEGQVYYLHVDPILLQKGQTPFDIRERLFGNALPSVFRPEDYKNAKITAEMILTLDQNNNICKQIIPSKYT